MAKSNIFPKKEFLDEMPYAERVVYDFMANLDNSFHIFYSVRWVKPKRNKNYIWKENDFLILSKTLGALVLEVKGGDITSDGLNIYQTNKDTYETSVLSPERRKDPLSQAIDGVYHYREIISDLDETLKDRFVVEPAVWFPGCNVKSIINKFPRMYREAQEIVLDNSSFNLGQTAIERIYKFYNAKNKTNVTDEEYSKILSLIAQDFELVEISGFKQKEMEFNFIKLTREQLSLLDYISEQKMATIQGSAGTGKTVIAREAAKRYSAIGRKVLFLCFNRYLSYELRHRFPMNNVDYYGIDEFISEKTGMIHTSDKEKVRHLNSIDWERLDYDDIVIDEAQDFLNEEIMYFKDYIELKEGHFLVFYDKNQLVIKKEVPEALQKAECKLILTRNCRNTYEIGQTSYSLIDLDLNKVNMISGQQPNICFLCGNSRQMIGKIIEYYTSNFNYENKDITILTLKTEEESVLYNCNKINNIRIGNEKNNSTVFFTTTKKFKGLENKVIIIIDVDKANFESIEKKMDFYVAASRATQNLSIIIDANNDELLQIANSIGVKIPMPPKGKILQKTKCKVLEL